MAFHLKEVVPWGRSFDEYVRMFNLSPIDLDRRIIGCGDGPAAFNAGMHAQERRMISVDPVYQFTEVDIRLRIEQTHATIMEQLHRKEDAFVWHDIKSREHLSQIRMAAMEIFLADFEKGKQEKRYTSHCLPDLPVPSASFDLALCSHLLFLYPDQLSMDFHKASIAEMLRVAGEVRIFPLLTLDGSQYPHLDAILDWIKASDHHHAMVRVNYEFQRGGNQMLNIWASHTTSHLKINVRVPGKAQNGEKAEHTRSM